MSYGVLLNVKGCSGEKKSGGDNMKEVRSPGNPAGSQLVNNSSVWKAVRLVGQKQVTANWLVLVQSS